MSTVTRTLHPVHTPLFPQGGRRKLCVALTPPRRQSIIWIHINPTVDRCATSSSSLIQFFLLPLVSHRRHRLTTSSDPGTRDRPVTQNDTCQQRLLDPGKTRSALYCGSGVSFAFAIDSDDCKSSDVHPRNRLSRYWMFSQRLHGCMMATLKALATTNGEL